jgi:rubrerythrin
MAITGKSCNGWAFWSLETPITPPATEAAQTEANTGVITTRKESELQEPASDPNLVKKSFARTPNQKGVPEGQTRWYCHDCGKSFVATGDEAPDTCPQGHKLS